MGVWGGAPGLFRVLGKTEVWTAIRTTKVVPSVKLYVIKHVFDAGD